MIVERKTDNLRDKGKDEEIIIQTRCEYDID